MRARTAVVLGVLVGLVLSGCGHKAAPEPRTLLGTWTRGNDRLTMILAFFQSENGLRFRWVRRAADGKRNTECDWDGTCVETVKGKKVGEYHCTLDPSSTADNASVSCRGWVEDGRRTDMTWTDDFVMDADGQSLRCYSEEMDGQHFEGNARPLRVFKKISRSVAYPPRRGPS